MRNRTLVHPHLARTAIATIACAASLAAAAPSGAAGAGPRVCARNLAPSGATLLARGVSCKTAKLVHGKVARQTHVAPFRFTVRGRRWTCTDPETWRLECRSSVGRVTIRIDE